VLALEGNSEQTLSAVNDSSEPINQELLYAARVSLDRT
jgi:hypothetical protein